mgnify:CR=1 FL=1
MKETEPASLAIRLALSVLLLFAHIPAAWSPDTRLPDLGNSAASLMTPKQERELGQAFMRNERRSQAVLDDPLLVGYVQHLGQRLVTARAARGAW